MNEADVLAVHAQPVPLVTLMVEDPPAGATLTLVGDSENAQTAAGVVVPVPVGVVVGLGVGVASFEQAAALRAIARSPSRESTFMDEVTPDNIAVRRGPVKHL